LAPTSLSGFSFAAAPALTGVSAIAVQAVATASNIAVENGICFDTGATTYNFIKCHDRSAW
jgi:hypothetical protein